MSATPAELALELFEADNETAVLRAGVPVVLPIERGMESQLSVDAAETGTVSFAIPAEYPRDEWSLITASRVVRLRIRDTYVGGFKCRPRRAELIPEEDGQAKRMHFEGVDLLAALDDALVLLKPGTESFAGPLDKRLFGWQDRDYDHSWWVEPFRGDLMYGEGADVVRPEAWFSGYTRWYRFNASVPAGGTILWRRNFTLSAPKILVPRMSAKGGLRAWVDGVPIGETVMPPGGDARGDTYRWPLKLEAGAHTISAEIVGSETEAPEFAYEVYAVDDAATGRCTASNLLFQSDDSDACKVAWVAGGDRPGLTAGGIIRMLVDEAKARGLLAGLSMSFTKETDSNGNPWPVMRQEFIVDIGRTLPEVLAQLAASECDVWMDPVGLTLHATRWRERGDFWTSPTGKPKFVGGGEGGYAPDPSGKSMNIRSFTWVHQLAPTDVRIRYRCRTGYGVVGSSGPERFYDFGDIDATAAAELAQATATARDEKLDSITFEVWPRGDEDRLPEAAWLGDAVSVPTGAPGSEVWAHQRIMSVTIREDSKYPGKAVVSPTVASSPQEFRSQTDRRIARMRAGNQTSTAINAPDDLGTGIRGGKASSEQMQFNNQGQPLREGAAISDKNPFPRDRRKLYRSAVLLTAVGVADTQLWLRQNGSRFQWINVPAGAAGTEAKEDYIGDHVGKGPQDYVQVEIDRTGDSGLGAEGLTVTLYHTEPL